MDSVPATVPSVTSSPGDAELLGPLSVLYAALLARLLEVTAHPWEGPAVPVVPGRRGPEASRAAGEAAALRIGH